jgi:hypothetical protein
MDGHKRKDKHIIHQTQAGVMCVMQVEKKAVFLVSKEKGDTSCLERNASVKYFIFKRIQIVIVEG